MLFFFFQAEDGIRDLTVTGVQTCALPICQAGEQQRQPVADEQRDDHVRRDEERLVERKALPVRRRVEQFEQERSEEHTSELQSQSNLVCRLLLEKKKIYNKTTIKKKN